MMPNIENELKNTLNMGGPTLRIKFYLGKGGTIYL